MEKQRTKKEKFSLFASPVKRDRLPVPLVPPTSPGLSKAEFLDRVRRSNQACQQGEYALAVRLYSEALTADPQNCILFSNRSAAYLRLGEYQQPLWMTPSKLVLSTPNGQ
ncbi:hypothetical protein KUCAC02_008981, partial [Chaenocephalus aceratus]